MSIHDDLNTLRLIGLTFEEQAAISRVAAELETLRAATDRLRNGIREIADGAKPADFGDPFTRWVNEKANILLSDKPRRYPSHGEVYDSRVDWPERHRGDGPI